MKKQTIIPFDLTNREKDFLLDMLSFYVEKMEHEESNISRYKGYAISSGEVSEIGDKYTANRRFFEIHDAIKKHIHERKKEAHNLIRKIINHKSYGTN